MPDPNLLPTRAATLARQLEFFARTRVEGFLKGANRSKLKGHSTDFLQHRQYMPGDDLRSLDWRVFARSDRLVIREYEEYTNLDVILGIDYSGSMGYEGDGMTKIDFARHCAAMLAYLLNLRKNRYGLAALAGTVLRFIRPSSGRKHLAKVFQELVTQTPDGETDIAACVWQLSRRIRRKSVFVFFSDCYQDPEALTKAVGALRLQGHDAIIYQVYDPAESELPFVGFTLFRDLETGQIDSADALQIRAAYREVFRRHIEQLEAGANSFGIEFHSLAVEPEWDKILATLLHERMARA